MESNSQQYGNNDLHIHADSKSRPVRKHGNDDGNCQSIAKCCGQQPYSVQGYSGITYGQRSDILHMVAIDKLVGYHRRKRKLLVVGQCRNIQCNSYWNFQWLYRLGTSHRNGKGQGNTNVHKSWSYM